MSDRDGVMETLDRWDDLTDEVLGERNSAIEKHGIDHTPLGSLLPASKCAVLVEEVGEVARWVNERELGNRPTIGDLRSELIQVAAVALMWAESLGGSDE
jgi:NTP pyrophosphatase (non-canonical NTP hydrolase)